MSDAFTGSITFTTDDEGNRRVTFTLSQPASLSATEAFESEDGRSEVSIDIVPPDVAETETHFIEGDDGEGDDLVIEIVGADNDDEGLPLAAEGGPNALSH